MSAKFGERLKGLRIAREKTLRDAAHETDLNASCWSAWERRADNPPAADTLIILADYFNLTGVEFEQFIRMAAACTRRCEFCENKDVLQRKPPDEPRSIDQLICPTCNSIYET